MSQVNSDEFKKRAELLKIAKQTLIQEYDAMRGTNHNQWLRDSQIAWKTKGVLIAYPTAKLFPTEQEVVAKALELYNQLNQPATSIPNTPIEPTLLITPKIQITDIENPVSYQNAVTPSITEQLQAAYNSPTSYSIVDNTKEITETLPILLSTTDLVQADGDGAIIDESIAVDNSNTIVEPTTSQGKSIIEEPVESAGLVGSAPVKHSLLRSVLSGWLTKEKDKSP